MKFSSIIIIRLFLLLACALPAINCCYAQTSVRVDNLLHRSDSAINAGEIHLAEKFTNEALQIAKSDGNEQLESKVLVNLISIKIEEENNVNIDEWYDHALQIVKRGKNKMEIANLWNIKARHLMYNQKYDEARDYYNQVAAVYTGLKPTPVVAYFYNDLGYLEEADGNFEKAVQWYLKAISIFEKTNDRNGLANSLGNIANTYFYLEDRRKAIDYALKSVAIRKETGDKEGIAIVYGNITRIYLQAGNMDSAGFYQKLYIHYAKQSGKKKTLTDTYANLAMMHHSGKRYEAAVIEMQHAISIGKTIQHPNLANFYRMCALFLGKMKNVGSMNAYYDSSLSLIKANNNKGQYRDYYATRMNYYKSTGDYQNALQNYELYIAYKDSVLNEGVKKQVAQLEIQYETQKKNLQLASEKNEKIKQQLYYNIALSLLTIGLLGGLFFFNRYKYRKKLEQRNLLLAERNRISSELHDEVGSSLSAIHLISHASINHLNKQHESVVHENLRKITYNSKKLMESLGDIVWSMNPDNDLMPRIIARMKVFSAEILEAADIMFEMTTDDLITDISLAPEKRRDLYLAFKEAINNASKYSHGSTVWVTITRQDNLITTIVKDDGIGFDTNNNDAGNGLRNMRQRMEKHGGTVVLKSILGNGSTITLNLPYA